MKRFLQSFALVLGLLAVAPVTNAATITVQLTPQLRFSPVRIQINVGDTVQFVNASNFGHTVTADPSLARVSSDVILPEGAEPFSSDTLRPGATFSHVFTTPGLYQYVCLPHELMGMIGQIVVVNPSNSQE